MKNFFIFNGKDSRDFDIQLGEYPPIVKPRERIEPVTVPGRSGTLHLKEGDYIYDSYVKPFNIVALDPSRIDEIKDWLQGSGELIIGNELDWIYDAYIFEQLEFTRFFRGWHRASLNIEVSPFKKSRRVFTQELLDDNTDNIINCAIEYPCPIEIIITNPDSNITALRLNGKKYASTIPTPSTVKPPWLKFNSQRGVVTFKSPQTGEIGIAKITENLMNAQLQNGINHCTISCQADSVVLSYREIKI